MHPFLILGASGLGGAVARALQEQNVPTIVVGTSVHDSEQSIACDLSKDDQVDELIARVAYMELDGFVWCAGVLLKEELQNGVLEQDRHCVDVNFRNPMMVANTIYRGFYGATSPKRFCVVSSTSGSKPRPGEVVYCATKFAQVGYVESLGRENSNPNILVSHFQPGGMQTPSWEQFGVDTDGFLRHEDVAAYMVKQIMDQQRLFLHEEIPRGFFDNK